MLRLNMASMRGKSIWLSLLMVSSLLFLYQTSMEVAAAFRASNSLQLVNNSIQKSLLMNRILNALGYGGAIHAFKDYELRHRETFHSLTLSRLSEAELSIKNYRQLGQLSKLEIQQLDKLTELISFIRPSLLPIKQMIKDRVKSPVMDNQLAVDYHPYRLAIDTLLQHLNEQQAKAISQLTIDNTVLAEQFLDLTNNINIFNSLCQHLGYGGIIHLYKNYLLHGNESTQTEYQTQMQALTNAVQALHHSSLYIAGKNDDLFNSIDQIPARYQHAIKQLINMRKQHASLHRLIFKSRVKEDKNYIQSLTAINNMLSNHFVAQRLSSQHYLAAVVASSQQRLEWSMITILLCILLIMYVFAFQLPRLMTKSIHAVKHMGGSQASELDHLSKRHDEFGVLALAIQYSANSMIEQETIRQQQVTQEKTRLEQQQREARNQHRKELADNFEKSLGVIISDVSAYVAQAYQQAELVSAMSHQLIQQSEQANDSSLKGISLVKSTENLSDHVQRSARDISEKSDDARKLAGQALYDTEEINHVIERLTDVSDRIGFVVRSISHIARNTRLLSMNATIEGAAAGEAGKGFAVVANEVKELASESAKAVEDIRVEISNMQQEISGTASLLSDTIKNIGAVHEGVQLVYDSVTSQVEVIQDVACNAGQASHSIQHVAKVIDHLSNDAEKSGDSSKKLFNLIESVDAKMKAADQSMQLFLQEIRN